MTKRNTTPATAQTLKARSKASAAQLKAQTSPSRSGSTPTKANDSCSEARKAGQESPTSGRPLTRADTLIELMRREGGASAVDLASAVGWQVHSVRGFIAGTLKKRSDLQVSAFKTEGLTRYHVQDRPTVHLG